MRPRSRLGLAPIAVLVCATACAPSAAPPTPWQIAPPGTSAVDYWNDAIHLMQVGDDADALADMNRAVQGGVASIPIEPSLFYRDVAEARLSGGDLPGAAEAARQARDALDVRPETAQFRAPERQLFEAEVDALEFAGQGDSERLAAVAQREPLLADPWYLLGWLDERRGDQDGARAAYRSYLARAPEGSFLRRTAVMQRHAEAVVSGPGG